jgi:hypothetical protein
MAVAALMLGWQAVRGSVQEHHHPMTVHHS